MSDWIAVSIIVPVYNCSQYIHNSLDSILTQSGRDFEVIFVDDSSTDDSLQKILNFSAKNPTICTSILVNKTNGGEGYSRNQGLDVAKGEFICFVDADDRLCPDFIKLLLHKAREGYDLVYCGYDIYNTWDGHIIKFEEKKKYLTNSTEIINRYLRAQNHFAHVGAIYRKSFLNKHNIKYYELCRFGTDIEFVCSVLLNNPSCSSVDKSLYQYLRRFESISTSITSDMISDCVDSLNRIQKKISHRKDKLTFVITRKAKTSYYLMEEVLDQNIPRLNNRKQVLHLVLLSIVHVLSKPGSRINRRCFQVLFNAFKLMKK